MSCHLHESNRASTADSMEKKYNFPQKPCQNLCLLRGAKTLSTCKNVCNSLAGLISYFFPRLYAKKICPFLSCLYLSSIDYAHLFARRMIEKYALVELVEWRRVESSGVESSRTELNSSEFRIHGIGDSF